MKKYIFIIISFTIFCLADSTSLENQLFKFELRQEKLENQIDSLVQFNQKLVDNNYTLQNRLLEYQIKEGFFDELASSQRTSFVTYMSILFAITIILVYLGYNYQSKIISDKFTGQLTTQKNSFVELKTKTEGLEYNMNISLGNISNLLSEFHLKNSNPFLCIKYAIISANYIHKATQIKSKNPDDRKRWEKAVLTMLVIANETLNQVTIDEVYREAFKQQQEEFFENLNGVSKSKSTEIYEQAAKFRLKLREIIKS